MGDNRGFEKTIKMIINWLPAAIAATAATIGVFSSIHKAKKQRKENRRVSDLNYQRYLEDFERNKPKQQMEYFREAGLNPNLIYGQSPAPSGGAPEVEPDQYEAVDHQALAGPMINEIADVQQRKAGVRKTVAETEGIEGKTHREQVEWEAKNPHLVKNYINQATKLEEEAHTAGSTSQIKQQEFLNMATMKESFSERDLVRKNWKQTTSKVRADIKTAQAQLTSLNQSNQARKELDLLLNEALKKQGPLTSATIKSIVYFLTTKYQ